MPWESRQSPVVTRVVTDTPGSNQGEGVFGDTEDVGNTGETPADDSVEDRSENEDNRDEDGGVEQTLASVLLEVQDTDIKAMRTLRKSSHKQKPLQRDSMVT